MLRRLLCLCVTLCYGVMSPGLCRSFGAALLQHSLNENMPSLSPCWGDTLSCSESFPCVTKKNTCCGDEIFSLLHVA